MSAVILIIHLFLALAIIGLVLLQRSEGGGLGIGGGGGMGALAGARSTANILTRATAICAGLFFVTSLTLGILAGTRSGSSIANQIGAAPATTLSVPAEGAAADANTVPEEAAPPATPAVPLAE